MEILEKILEEIDDIYVDDIAGYGVECNLKERTNLPCNNCYECIKDACKAIVCKHMNNGKDINVISNDGWIPVEERLPENGTYLCTLDGELCGIDEPFTGMCGIENGKWDEEGCVIAWQPLPEPYRRPKKEKPPCKEHIMRRFMKVE